MSPITPLELHESTQKYLKVPRSTSKYPEVPQSTQKYLSTIWSGLVSLEQFVTVKSSFEHRELYVGMGWDGTGYP